MLQLRANKTVSYYCLLYAQWYIQLSSCHLPSHHARTPAHLPLDGTVTVWICTVLSPGAMYTKSTASPGEPTSATATPALPPAPALIDVNLPGDTLTYLLFSPKKEYPLASTGDADHSDHFTASGEGAAGVGLAAPAPPPPQCDNARACWPLGNAARAVVPLPEVVFGRACRLWPQVCG